MLYADLGIRSYEDPQGAPVVALRSYLALCRDLARVAFERMDTLSDESLTRLCDLSDALCAVSEN